MKKIILFLSTLWIVWISIFLPAHAQEEILTGAELTLIEVTGATSGDVYPAKMVDNQYTFEIDAKKDKEVLFKFEAAEQSVIRFRTTENPIDYTFWESPIDTKSYPIGHTYYVSVTAYGGTPVQEYVIHLGVLDDRNSDASLKALVVQGENQVFNPTEPILSYTYADTYTYEIPYAYPSISILPTTNDGLASVYLNQDKLAWENEIDMSDVEPLQTKEISLWVQAENEAWCRDSSGNSAPYIIQLKRLEPSSDAFLKGLTVDGLALEGFTTEDLNKTYELIVDHQKTSLEYHMELPEYATSNVTADGTIPIVNGIGRLEIIVTSEDLSVENHYTITVYAADTDFEITNIRILDYEKSFELVDGQAVLKELVDLTDDHNELIYQFGENLNPELSFIYTLQYGDPTPYLYIECKSAYATFFGGGKIDVAGGNEEPVIRSVYAVSEYGILNPKASNTQSRTYKFEFYRTAVSEENHINTLYFMPDAGLPSNLKVSPSGGIGDKEISTIYVANVLPETKKLDVEITVVSDKSNAYINGATTPSLTASVAIAWSTQNDFRFPIVVEAESGARRTYEVVVSMDHLENYTDHTIERIELATDQNQTYLYDFNSTTPVLWKLDGYQNECTIEVAKPDFSLSTLWVKFNFPDGTTQEGHELKTTIPLQVGTTKVTIYAVSMSGEEGKHYTIDILKEALSNDASLDYLSINEMKVTNVQSETRIYLEHGTADAFIEAYSSHFATIMMDGVEQASCHMALVTGKNEITITVVSQSEKVRVNYKLYLEVDERIDIENISIVTDASTTPSDYHFDKEVSEYLLNIPYAVKQIQVDYQLAQGIDETLLTISGAGLIETNESKDITVVFQAKSGTSKKYIFHLNKIPASKENDLLSVTINGVLIQKENFDENNYTQILLDRSTTKVTIEAIVVSNLATYQLFQELDVVVGKNERHILVTSESLETKDYWIDIFCANNEIKLNQLELLDKNERKLVDVDGKSLEFDSTILNYSFEVSYFNDKVKLNVLKDEYSMIVFNQKESDGTSFDLNLSNIGSENSNCFTLMLISEANHYGYLNSLKGSIYTIEIKRRVLGTENKILKYINELGQEMDIINDTIHYEVTPDILTFHPTLEVSTSARAEYPVDVELKDGSNLFIIKVFAENGNIHQYTVDIFRTSLNPITMTLEFIKKNYIAYDIIAKSDVIVTLFYPNGSTHITRNFDFIYSEEHAYLEVGLEQLILKHQELTVTVPLKDSIVISPLKVTKPKPDTTAYTYTGSEQKYQLEVSQWYDISNQTQTDAGNYSILIHLKDSKNTVWDDGSALDLNYDFVISKATYDLSGITLSDQTIVYDGKPHQVGIEGALPEGVLPTYKNETQTNAGTYTVSVSFTGDLKNYEPIDVVLTAQFIIQPFKIAKPLKDTNAYTYTGEALTYQIEESPWYTVTSQTQTDAGIYAVLIRLTDPKNTVWMDDSISSLSYDFVISKATYDLSGITLPNQTIVYDGKPHQVGIEGSLPKGVIATYENETQTDVGVYMVSVSFTGDLKNYEAIDVVLTATLMIIPSTIHTLNVKVMDVENGFPIDATLMIEKIESTYHGQYQVEEAYQFYILVGEEKRPLTEQMEVSITLSPDKAYHVFDGTTLEEVDFKFEDGVLSFKGRNRIIITYESPLGYPYQWMIPSILVVIILGCLSIYICRKKYFILKK